MLNHSGTIEIKTERLLLRKFALADAEDMLKYWISYPMVQYQYLDAAVPSMEEVEELLKNWIKQYDKENYYHWAIIEIESDCCIGHFGLWYDEEDDTWMPTYCIGEKFQCKGYMTEAYKAVIKFAFTQLNVEKLDVATRSANIASQQVINKCGFIHVDTEKNALYENGIIMDRYFYALTKDEWLRIK